MKTTLAILLTILEAFLSSLETKTLTSDFDLSVSQEVAQPIHYNGHITMRGDCFLLSMMSNEAAYDGKTLYLYDEALDETTLSHPTQDELLTSNPFLYARALYKVCNLSERKSKSGDEDIITLTPKDQSIGIRRFVMHLKNGLPLSIEVFEEHQSTLVKLKGAKFTDAKYTFALDKKGAYINDLR